MRESGVRRPQSVPARDMPLVQAGSLSEEMSWRRLMRGSEVT